VIEVAPVDAGMLACAGLVASLIIFANVIHGIEQFDQTGTNAAAAISGAVAFLSLVLLMSLLMSLRVPK
jgi:hypothetical protein